MTHITLRMAGSGSVVVDWGDGTPVPLTPPLMSTRQTYISPTGLTSGAVIRVEAENGITTLDCSYNNLTGLDMSNNTALMELACTSNKMDTAALNTLFGTLHSNAGGKIIRCGTNPGYSTANRTIATSKGWDVSFY